MLYFKLDLILCPHFLDTIDEGFKLLSHLPPLLSGSFLILNLILIIPIGSLLPLQMLNTTSNFTVELHIICLLLAQHHGIV